MWKQLKLGLMTTAAILVITLLGATEAMAKEKVVVFENVEIDELVIQGLEVTERTTVDIYAVGGGQSYHSDLFAFAWIIDADDREIVWSMNDECDEWDRVSGILIECESTLRLRPGKYEAYYYVGVPRLSSGYNISVNDLGDLIEIFGDIFNQDEYEERDFLEDDIEDLTLVIESEEDKIRLYTPQFDNYPGAFVSITRPGPEEYISQGFKLSKEIELDVYAIGEYGSSYEVFVDGAWIIDASTRKKVWEMDKWNTDPAGGARKNRYFRDRITLPAGEYIAYYATDDSHDADEWNAPPPGDPNNYGLTVSTVDKDAVSGVADYSDGQGETEIVRLTRIRDDEFERAGFVLNKDAKIHIVGLGERDYSNDYLVDYGWITNAETMERVWEMDAEDCGFAGGGAKNAMFDGIIELEAGNYIVYYRSDGSHSYGDWNVTPPFNRRGWGISLYGVGSDFSENSFELFDDFEPAGNVLVNLTGVGDDEEVRAKFTLDNDSQVRIMALGEGTGRTMHDYGWIENDRTGEVVWEMTYRKTRNAGGAEKNRKAIANISLEKGTYVAYFITDGSHSIERFNASPPDEPERWGMVITKK
ncbi:MAG: hypothetical protein V3V99_13545 [candidate division Zixibacteria bacterium]